MSLFPTSFLPLLSATLIFQNTMSKDKGAAAADGSINPEVAKLAHSIFYANNTSEIKDDLQALVDNYKGGGGKLLTKLEAGFLLW